MNKKQRAQAYATNMLLEHGNTHEKDGIVRPSQEAIIQAKEAVDENEK